MNQELEIEFKNIVSETEFNRLLHAFSINKEQFVYQENFYFDTGNFSLKNKGSALRIRYKKGIYSLTLKQPNEIGLLETHQALTEQEAKQMLNGGNFIQGDIYQLIESIGIDSKEVKLLGLLKTNRAETSYDGGTLVFDHSTYLGIEDYEIEYEVSNYEEGKNHFLQLLKKHSIPIRKTDNKIKRFFIEKQRQQSN